MKRKISSTVSNVLWQIYGSKDSPCFDCFFFVLFLLHVFIYEFVFPLCFSLSALLESQKKVFIQSFAACGFHEILSLAVCFWYFASGFDFCLLLFIFLFPYNYSSVVVICSLVSSIFALFCCIELAIRGKLDWFVSIQWCMFCLFFFCSFHHL